MPFRVGRKVGDHDAKDRFATLHREGNPRLVRPRMSERRQDGREEGSGEPLGESCPGGEEGVGRRICEEDASVFFTEEDRRRGQASENADRRLAFALEELGPFPTLSDMAPNASTSRARSSVSGVRIGPGLASTDTLRSGDEILERSRKLERAAPAEREGSECDTDCEKDERIHRFAPRGVFAEDDGERGRFSLERVTAASTARLAPGRAGPRRTADSLAPFASAAATSEGSRSGASPAATGTARDAAASVPSR